MTHTMNIDPVHAQSIKTMLLQIKRTSLGAMNELASMEAEVNKLCRSRSERATVKLSSKIKSMVSTNSDYLAGLHSFSWGVINHHLDQLLKD